MAARRPHLRTPLLAASLVAIGLFFGCDEKDSDTVLRGKGETAEAGNATAASYMTALPNSMGVHASGSQLLAFSPDGRLGWKVTIPRGDVVAPVAASPNSRIYLRTANHLLCYSHEGKLLWEVDGAAPPPKADARVCMPVALADSSVAIVLAEDELRAFETNGSEKWAVDLPDGPVVAPLVPFGNGQLTAETRRSLHMISPDGKILWSRSLSRI
jgi:hypothetical protein